jgi:hypothetical protein
VLWRDAWIGAPGFEVPESGIPIEVSAATPLAEVENASGRRQATAATVAAERCASIHASFSE